MSEEPVHVIEHLAVVLACSREQILGIHEECRAAWNVPSPRGREDAGNRCVCEEVLQKG
jgi:hypothetical protein